MRDLRRSADDWALARQPAEPALAALLGEADTSRDQADRMTGWAAVDTGPDVADQEAFALYDAVTAALVAVSQHRPVVVVLDDLHWADPASLRLLSFAAQHTWFERLLLIGTYRDAEVESVSTAAPAADAAGREGHHDHPHRPRPRRGGRTDDQDRRAGARRRPRRRGAPAHRRQPVLHRADRPAVARRRRGRHDRTRRTGGGAPPPGPTAAGRGRGAHRRRRAGARVPPSGPRGLRGGPGGGGRPAAGPRGDRPAGGRPGGGRFAFAHDLVRETLYDGLTDDERQARHGAVVRAVDDLRELTDRLIPADLARHAYLAGPALDPARVATLLVAAGRDAFARLAGDEAAVHFRRALDIVEDRTQRVRILIEFAESHYHHAGRDQVVQLLAEAARLARSLDDPALLARVALTVNRNRQVETAYSVEAAELVREAYRRLIGEPDPAAAVGTLIADLITATETIARRGQDDEALTFSLWARHDTTWGWHRRDPRRAHGRDPGRGPAER
ncbi:AAA family ATPase [Micromonospora sp. M12]